MREPRLVRVAGIDDLRDGGILPVRTDGYEFVLVNVRGHFYAVDNLCSHGGGWLEWGCVHVETLEIECPLHGGRFDLRSGEATAEPCEFPIPTYQVEVLGSDVYVGLPD